MEKKIWFFNWLPTGSGPRGYNSVLAVNKKEALKEIDREFGNLAILKPDLSTLKIISREELNEIDKAHASLFD